MDWILFAIFGIAAIGLVIFLVRKNQKDEKTFEKQLNNDYPKLNDKEDDGDPSEN